MKVGVGQALPPRSQGDIDIPRIQGVMELMHDTNAVHVDAELARSLGLRGPVNQGPANLAYTLEMLHAWAGPGAFVEHVDFRFTDLVTTGDVLTAGGVVTAVDGRRVTCDVWLDRDDGVRALEASVRVRLAGADA